MLQPINLTASLFNLIVRHYIEYNYSVFFVFCTVFYFRISALECVSHFDVHNAITSACLKIFSKIVLFYLYSIRKYYFMIHDEVAEYTHNYYSELKLDNDPIKYNYVLTSEYIQQQISHICYACHNISIQKETETKIQCFTSPMEWNVIIVIMN